jgi:starch phosphorylase
MTGTLYTIEVQPRIPEALSRLTDLANDLMYSWDRHVRNMFYWLDPQLWEACNHNPRVFLRRVDQARLERAAEDPLYIKKYNSCISGYDSYLEQRPIPELAEHLDPQHDLVAYFCAEFGLHESLPIYSGGLGILAGDHCKAASDMGVPFVAVGLLYSRGYFHQNIDGAGNQHAHYIETRFEDIPAFPAVDPAGNEVTVEVPINDQDVVVKVWRAEAGHITLYLLDTDIAQNRAEHRGITHQLYGGDNQTRIQQEIVLGIGGVRALRALRVSPTVWHINEGHAAFLVLERVRELVASGLNFDSALEAVSGATVFTTHTPVPAGHDIFSRDLVQAHLAMYIKDLGLTEDRFMALGESPEARGQFNQTALAVRGSRFQNGVSRIHGTVSAEMCEFAWPQVPPEENPLTYITNGVHVPSFLHREWSYSFDVHFDSEWRDKMLNAPFWEGVENIPDHAFWSSHQTIKTLLIEDLRNRLQAQHTRNGLGSGEIERLTAQLKADTLLVGFARRFATYKRATLLFSDPARLARLVNDPERPVVFLFAGKAHPNDTPGQDLIRSINEFAHRPEFEGRILLVEGYDMALARKLVSGVDVWLNNPEHPLEASGTSGQKAGINGVLNLSVLDGWWAEGYKPGNGWAIRPHGPKFDPLERDREEGLELLDILEEEVVPLYYKRNGHGYSSEWIKRAKRSMITTLPRFNAQRMVMDYVRRCYAPASRQGRRLSADGHRNAQELARWKRFVASAWGKVRLRRVDEPPAELSSGDRLALRVLAGLGELSPDDVAVECLLGRPGSDSTFKVHGSHRLRAAEKTSSGDTLFALDLDLETCGLHHYKLRIYPIHPMLTHPFETGCMVWL